MALSTSPNGHGPVEPRAVGFLEAQGFIAVFEAVDAMTKTARIEVGGLIKLGSALIAVSVRGDLASVIEAVEVGEETVRSLYSVEVRSIVFANPTPAVEALGRAPAAVIS
jgi:microcompartment protein CcmL/EutN